MNTNVIVEMRGISKSFPGVAALQNVDFTLERACVHGLVGENGAGKSTLMKILSGAHQQDTGEMLFDGKSVKFKTEKEALELGISIVPQELSYIPELTVEENIFIGREPTYAGFLQKRQRHERASTLLKSLGLSLSSKVKMKNLSIAQCQMVEVIKAISRNARIIIMDEPTSSLTPVETQQLFTQIKNLRQQGLSLIYISHKLEEIMELCDSITVMRDSRVIGSMPRGEADVDKLITMMVGREMGKLFPTINTDIGKEILRVEALSEPGVFREISFNVKSGEVIGFSGMVGAGRSEVMRALFGIDSYSSGKVHIDGKYIRVRSPRDSIKAGVGMITEDRAVYGFVPGLSVSDNILLPNEDDFSKIGFLQKGKIREAVSRIVQRLAVRVPNNKALVRNLSGGNQQKVVLAKWLVRGEKVKVLILDEPTRGIDIGAKQEIYKLIKTFSDQGMAVILVSSEMPELIGLCHRIFVMDGGRILKEYDHAQVSQDAIMQTIIEGGRTL